MRALSHISLLVLAGCGARSGVIDDPVDAGTPPPDAEPECREDEDCVDDVFCNGEERCLGGRCARGIPEDCSDGDLCTVDECDAELDECVHVSIREDGDGDGHYPEPCGLDCDDEDPLIYPGAPERCNGLDDDCDDAVDEDLLYLPTKIESRITFDPVPNIAAGLAWADDHYVASHYDQQDPSVFLTLLAEDGERLSEDVDLSLHPGDAYGAGLEWSGRVLGTVWEDRRDGDFEIYFQRLNDEAQKLQPDMRVTRAREFSINPSLAWTGTEFAIAWQDSRFWGVEPDNDEVFFQRIAEDGEILGLETQVTDSATASLAPSLVWADDGYGVAWTELLEGGNHEIFLQRLSAVGEAVGSPARITRNAGESTGVSLVWADGEYAIVWEEDTGRCAGSSTGIPGSCFARIDAEGTVLYEDRVDDGSSYARFPTIHWTGAQYILVWADWRHGQFELYYSMRDEEGTVILDDTRLTEAVGDSFGAVTAAAEGTVGILFTDTRDGDHEVYFLCLTCDTGPTIDD